MNILLLEHEQINNSLATVSGEKARHISTILKLKVGDSLRVGIINGKIGKGEIINIEEDEVKLLIQCDRWSNWQFSFHEQIDGASWDVVF